MTEAHNDRALVITIFHFFAPANPICITIAICEASKNPIFYGWAQRHSGILSNPDVTMIYVHWPAKPFLLVGPRTIYLACDTLCMAWISDFSTQFSKVLHLVARHAAIQHRRAHSIPTQANMNRGQKLPVANRSRSRQSIPLLVPFCPLFGLGFCFLLLYVVWWHWISAHAKHLRRRTQKTGQQSEKIH